MGLTKEQYHSDLVDLKRHLKDHIYTLEIVIYHKPTNYEGTESEWMKEILGRMKESKEIIEYCDKHISDGYE